MALEEAYFISQIAAAVGVVLSLVFVGLQVRQNTRSLELNTAAVQIGAYHQAIDQIKDAWMQPDYVELLERARDGGATLDAAECRRLSVLLSADLFGHEIALHLAESGLIDRALWDNMLDNNRGHLASGPHRALLATRPGVLSARLRAVLDAGAAGGAAPEAGSPTQELREQP